MPTTRWCATKGCCNPPIWGSWCLVCAHETNDGTTHEEHAYG